MSAAPPPPNDLVRRFRRWLAWGVAVAALLYVGFSLTAGLDEVGDALASFTWWMYLPVLGLTLVNYGLRFWKWHYLITRLGARIPWREDLAIFVAGLAMVISPGKAGEVLKPYLVRARTGFPMAQTIPALVTERLTDGIAVLALAAVSVSTYAGEKAHYVWIPIGICVAGLGVLMHGGLSMAILRLVTRIPMLAKVGHKLEEMYTAMRACVAPVPLALTVIASVVAWFAECVGYMLVFRGFGVDASLDASTFLYAFATVAGGAMPGGLGVADGALGYGAPTIVSGLTLPVSLAASLLIRLATLWFGVVLGAIALVRVGSTLDQPATD